MKLNLDFYTEDEKNVLDEKVKEQLKKYFLNIDCNLEINENTSVDDYLILTDSRKNIVSWYEFKNNANVLELNPNLGEITGFLCEKFKDVVCISDSKEKGFAISNRYAKNKNLEVIVANYKKVNFSKNFDYVLIIGEENFAKLIDKIKFAKEHLAKDGKILVAFNNKFGMQYWTGIKAEEKEQYSTITGKTNGITLDKVENEIERLSLNYKVYYPLPDYKLTNAIFSDEYLPDSKNMMSRNLVYAKEDEYCEFGQREAYIELLKENKDKFKLFANSYFIEISSENIENEIRYVNFEIYRKHEYNIKTVIKDTVVEKTANAELAQNHINTIEKNIDILKNKNIKTLDKYENNKIISRFVKNAISYDKYIVDICEKEGKDKAFKLLEDFKTKILDKFEIINKPEENVFKKYCIEEDFSDLHYVEDGLLDLNTSNCFVVDDEPYIYDQEWYEKNVPIEFILYRTLFYNHNLAKYIPKEELYEHFGISKYIEKFEQLDNAIQDSIRNKYFWNLHVKSVSYIGRKNRELIQKDNMINKKNAELTESNRIKNELEKQNIELKKKYEEIGNTISNLNTQVTLANGRADDFENRLRIIEKSLSWRITKPLRYISWVFNFKNKIKLVDRIMPPGSKMRDIYEKNRHQRILKKVTDTFLPYTDLKTAEYWANMLERENNIVLSPINAYYSWIINNEPTKEELEKQKNVKFAYNPKISIIIPLYNTPVNFFRELLYFMHEQTYQNWELCLADGSKEPLEEIKSMIKNETRIKYKFIGENKGISGNTNEALSLATGDFIALLDHDDYLSKDCLYEVVKCINENPNVEFIYTDEDKATEFDAERYEPFFKPDFARDTLNTTNYICHFSVFKKELMDKLKGFRSEFDGAQDYDIILRMADNTKEIVHIPKILYHWRVHRASTAMLGDAKPWAFEAGLLAVQDYLKRNHIKGRAEHGKSLGTYRIIYDIEGNPKVSIIIPNKDGIDILKVCVDSILEKTTYNNYEINIIENNSEEKETFEYYKELEENPRVNILYYPEKGFNYSKIINYGVRHSDGDFIVQLNNDTELLTPDWLENMIGYCQNDEVGAVGVALYYPDDTYQHAGIIIGMLTLAGHRFKNLPRNSHGYFAMEGMIQDLSAVTAACIMTKKSTYEDVGYMNEDLAVAFNDIDFCMKIRQLNKRIVYNPFIEFYHYESKTRGEENTPEKQARFVNEIKTFKSIWQKTMDKGDPYYNKNLDLDNTDYTVYPGKRD